MKHVELFENYNPKNWGPKSGYWSYDNHPFVGKKVVDLYPNFDFDNFGLDEDAIVHSLDIHDNTRGDWNGGKSGYLGDIYLGNPGDDSTQYHFYTDNDENIKILSYIKGDNRACFCIPGKDTFVSLGHDGPLIYDTITGRLLLDYGW